MQKIVENLRCDIKDYLSILKTFNTVFKGTQLNNNILKCLLIITCGAESQTKIWLWEEKIQTWSRRNSQGFESRYSAKHCTDISKY